MARALQATGEKEEAKEHFKLFQHMTSTKISAAIGLAYGEQGHYSTVTPVEEPQARQQRDDSGEAGGGDDGSCDPTHAAKARRGWGTRVFGNWRRLHAGRDRVGADGPGADGVGRAGDSGAASGWRREI